MKSETTPLHLQVQPIYEMPDTFDRVPDLPSPLGNVDSRLGLATQNTLIRGDGNTRTRGLRVRAASESVIGGGSAGGSWAGQWQTGGHGNSGAADAAGSSGAGGWGGDMRTDPEKERDFLRERVK